MDGPTLVDVLIGCRLASRNRTVVDDVISAVRIVVHLCDYDIPVIKDSFDDGDVTEVSGLVDQNGTGCRSTVDEVSRGASA